jgi:peptidoglycan/xylan/chitin deacetylase (PgdA/CDA1 family)
VITVDDGHLSVVREMLPLVREFNVPVTLFIYPSAISNASYALTWEDLRSIPRVFSSIPGYRKPVEHPYEIIRLSLDRAQSRTQVAPLHFRPWLQAFRDYAFGGRPFTAGEIRSQIKAAEDFGANGWMLWNPRNQYSAADLKPHSQSTDGPTEMSPR